MTPSLRKLALAALGVATAAGLLWAAASVHLHRACTVMDTPYLPICPETPTEPEQLRQQLRARIAANPGDAGAWAKLVGAEEGAAKQAALRAALVLAPNHPDVRYARAVQALEQNELPLAVDLLVQMVHFERNASAAQVLARLVAEGHAAPLLTAHAATAEGWLPRLISAMLTLKLPLAPALPVMTEAVAKGTAPAPTVRSFMRSLKGSGQWWEAYPLWAALQRQQVPVLFNAGFDQPFQPDGFDWEITRTLPSRAGAVVEQRRFAGRGQVLEIQYTGRAVVTPVVRQYLFIPPGSYQVRGSYMTTKLRMEEGLAWAVRCVEGDKVEAGKSDALRDTAGLWQQFQFEVTIPENCGAVASLQLETFAAFEARAGFRGRAMFDAFELRRENL